MIELLFELELDGVDFFEIFGEFDVVRRFLLNDFVSCVVLFIKNVVYF